MDNSDEFKAAVKEGLKEWCNEALREFGWFSLKTIVALGLAGIIWLALISAGWHKG